MAAKIWKKILFFALIFACVFNITYKFVRKTPFIKELNSSAQYVNDNKQQKK